MNNEYENGFRDGKIWSRQNPGEDNNAWMIFGFSVGMIFMFIICMIGQAVYG